MTTRVAILPITLLASFALMWFAKGILIPLMLAVLLAQLLSPVVKRLERFFPTGIAVLISLILLGGALFAMAYLLSNQLAALEEAVPQVKERFNGVLSDWQQYMATHFGMARSKQLNLLNKGLETSISAGGGLAMMALSFTLSTVAEFALIVILTFLMLYYRRHFRRQLKLLAEARDWRTFGEVLESVSTLGQSYVSGLAIVIVLVGALDCAGLYLVGAPFPVLFAVVAALAVLIPYVGIAVVAPLCAALTFVVSGGAGLAGAVLLVFLVVHFLEGNVFSPFLVGSKVDLNPLATILAVIVGGELWGPAGMLLFIPLIGIVKLTLDALPNARPIARIIGPISQEDLAPRWRRLQIFRRRREKAAAATESTRPISQEAAPLA